MEIKARYTLIGAFTLAVLIGAFGFLYWLKNVGGIGQRMVYDVRFEQPVNGITAGTNVLFNGVRVGVVTRVELDPSNPKRVSAQISIDPRTPVRADTQVDVAYQGFTGAAAIALKGGSADAPPPVGQNGQPPLLIAQPGAGRGLGESAQDTLRRVDEILAENAKPLSAAINGIATFADMLGRNSQRIEGLLGGLESLAGTGAPKQGPVIYDLAAASAFPDSQKAMKTQIVVPDPSAILLFDSQKIFIRSEAGIYSSVSNAQWADNLPKLVQARIVQSFENARQLGAVSRPLDQLNPQYRLELTIRSFQIALQPAPQAVVDITARLISDKGDVAGARAFTVAVPAKSAAAADAVAALNQAFAQLAAEMVAWTLGAV